MNAIVSPHIRVRYPELFTIGHYSVVDDFCYFSTRIVIGICSHVASGCSIAGGREHRFELGDYSSLSSGVKIWCESNDYINDLVALLPPGVDVGDQPVAGDVTCGHFTGVGANTVVMPDNTIPEGVAIGALSFVPPAYAFQPWMVYAGIPIRPLRPRNRANVLQQAERLRVALAHGSGDSAKAVRQ